jgi:hypothetical protein
LKSCSITASRKSRRWVEVPRALYFSYVN